MKEKTEKRTRFGVANLVWALVSFGIFMAVGLTGHYMAVGEFVTAELAGTYAILALVGAAAVLLRLWRFTLFFYLGCGLGWGAGWFTTGRYCLTPTWSGWRRRQRWTAIRLPQKASNPSGSV